MHPNYSNNLFQHHIESDDNWIQGQLSVESKLLESLSDSESSQLCLGLKEYALKYLTFWERQILVWQTVSSHPSYLQSKSEYPLVHLFLCDPVRAQSFFSFHKMITRISHVNYQVKKYFQVVKMWTSYLIPVSTPVLTTSSFPGQGT